VALLQGTRQGFWRRLCSVGPSCFSTPARRASGRGLH